MAFTPYGVMEKGQELTDDKLPAAFLAHLVNDAGAAEYIDNKAYETKVVEVVEKKLQSSPSLQAANPSPKKTRGRPKKTPR